MQRLEQELEKVVYERDSSRRHVETLRGEVTELMRELSKMKDENGGFQRQLEEAQQQLEKQQQQHKEEEESGEGGV